MTLVRLDSFQILVANEQMDVATRDKVIIRYPIVGWRVETNLNSATSV